ncbi:MAG: PQQ-dependent sugar dehydrogenase [Myxococcales bacterium]|nr:PQQ-dependent sugar dehydrogenase [Myxococcales bacterium]
MKRRTWILLGISVVIALGLIFGMRTIRRALVRAFDTGYQAPTVDSAGAASREASGIQLGLVVTGLSEPTDIQFVPGQPDHAIFLEKGGKARYVRVPASGDAVDAEKAPLVVSLDVRTNSELGLLGLAFHPKYAENGLFYLNYNPKGGELRTVVSEWHLPAAELGKRPAKETRVLLDFEQPYENHDGGQLAFGPDGFLYIGVGDGGFKNDPHGNGQNKRTLLGSMLRIDIDDKQAGKEYAIPEDNPFVGKPDARPEIYAYGLRNPWRFSFDPQGRLLVADVGQGTWEEVDFVRAGDNLGWNTREGRHCFSPDEGCSTEGLVDPIAEYNHEIGKSITGGYVYHGEKLPQLKGKYLFGDFVDGRVWAITLPKELDPGEPMLPLEDLGQWPYLISTFGQDASGEIYMSDYSRGDIYRFEPKP